MIWILLLGIAAVLFYYYFVKPLHYWSEKGVKQTKPVVFVGDSLRTILRRENITLLANAIYDMYPGTRYTGLYQFNIPTLLIKDPELIKQITVKDFDHFTDHRSFIDPEVDPFWGKNLFALRGQPWRDMRSTLSGSFTSSKMRIMFGLMKEASESFVQHFLNKGEKLIEVEMKNTFTRYTNDVIATTAFGIKVDSLKDQNNEFYLMGKATTDFTGLWKNLKFFAIILFPRIIKLLHVHFFSAKIRAFFRNLVHDTIKTREEQGIIRPDMINLLMEAKKGNYKQNEENGVIDSGFAVVQESTEIGLKSKSQTTITNDDITSQALIFFFAGFDTVSSLMCFLAYELAVNQDIQQKLRVEINRTNEECKGNLTYEALLKMKYLDMVISEALRKWPPASVLDRVCTKPYTIEPVTADEKPIRIKTGETFWIPVFAIHRDPENYPDPEKFDPERFSDENKDNIKSYTYFPFGVGPRNCIGSRFALLETKAVFFNILSNFEIVPTAKTQIPLKINKTAFNLTSENGFWYGFKRI